MNTSWTISPPGSPSPSWRKPYGTVGLTTTNNGPRIRLKRMRGLFLFRIAGRIALQHIKGKRGKMEINRLPWRAAQPGVLFPGRAAQPGVLFPGRAAQPGVLFPGRADKGREAAGGHAVGTSFASHSRLGLFDRLFLSIGRIGRIGRIGPIDICPVLRFIRVSCVISAIFGDKKNFARMNGTEFGMR